MRLALAVLLCAACGKHADNSIGRENTEAVKAAIPRLHALIASAGVPATDIDDWKAKTSSACETFWRDQDEGVTDQALVAEYKTLCSHDVPLAELRMAVERAEAHAKDPSGDHLKDCVNSELQVARDELQKYHTADAASQDLERRLAAVCPK
jgi:hypothetical protein